MTAHATLNGTITATGNGNCDERGFDWGYETGVYDYHWTETGSFGTGAFNHVITGLPLSDTVYFRAKAHSTAGWGYGSELTFDTPAPASYHFLAPMVRMIASPLGGVKQIRDELVITMRKAVHKFQVQPKMGVS